MIHPCYWIRLLEDAVTEFEKHNIICCMTLKRSILFPMYQKAVNADTRFRTNGKVTGVKVLED